MTDRRRPNFFIVGAMKAGTSAMHRYLGANPQIYMSPRKEPRYFAPDLDSGGSADGRWFTRDLDEYLDNFAGATDECIVGESSHVYLHSSKAARLIKGFAPDARILVMLRDPVQMIHARHQQSVWMGREDIVDFAEALAAEADRRAGRRLPHDAPYLRGLQYREACTLTPQVGRYLETFGRERVHFVVLESLAADPRRTYRGVLEFLGVASDFVPSDMGVANPSKAARSLRLRRLTLRLSAGERNVKRVPEPLRSIVTLPAKALRTLNRRITPRRQMPAWLEEQLTREFAPDVAELERLLAIDLTQHWPRFRGVRPGDR